MSELKPCPMCGGPAEMDTLRGYRRWSDGSVGNAIAVYCTECTLEISVCRDDVPDIEPEQVAEMWDRRTQPAAPADATEDELLDLEQALERRRILEEIKKVAEVHPANDMPTPFQSAWQQCCEEIFYRATDGQWHMDEDASRFAKNHAAPEPRQPMSACPHGVPHRWSCGECDTGVEMLAPADAAPSVAPEPIAWKWQHDETGRTGFVGAGFDRAHWEEHNPRLQIIAPCFAHPPRAPLTRDEIRSIFMAHGFTIKDGNDDLKEYVYEAARALEQAHGIGGK